MARKKVTYKEPAGYFNPAMRKAAEDWERNRKKEAQKQTADKSKKK